MQFLKKRLKSFGYAFKGIQFLLTTQPNAWIHLIILSIAILLGIFLVCNATEWAILSITFGLVLAAEAINTSIETLTDLVSPDYHDLAGKAKDVAAGAVLITAISAIAVGIFIFLPKILALWH